MGDVQHPKRVLATYQRKGDPVEVLEQLVAELHQAADPDDAALELGCGELSSLLYQGHGELLWPRMEELARADPLFRRALRVVVAEPKFDERQALMLELREEWPVTLRFIVAPLRLGSEVPLGARALEVDPHVSPRELARLLRRMARWMDDRADRDDAFDRIGANYNGLRPRELAERYVALTAAGEPDDGDGDGDWIRAVFHEGRRPDGAAVTAELWLRLLGHAGDAAPALDGTARRKVLLGLGAAVEQFVGRHPSRMIDIITRPDRNEHGFADVRAVLMDEQVKVGGLDGWWWSDEAVAACERAFVQQCQAERAARRAAST